MNTSESTKTIKVRVKFTAVIDPKTWSQTYGIELKDVREDVKRHVEAGFREELLHKIQPHLDEGRYG